MKWIGITGPMGGGKSTVSAYLRQKGYTVIDADQIVHSILGPGGKAEQKIYETFGEGVRNTQGFIDRRALGQLVFGDVRKLGLLEKILHPLVRAEVAEEKQRLERAGHSAAFYDVPLLFEKRMESTFDAVIVVTASEAKRRERFKTRAKMTDEEFVARSERQMPASEKEAKANFLIRNEGDRTVLFKEIESCLVALRVPPPLPAPA